MRLRIRKSFKILAPGSSLRRRVAYSLALARLILVPVIFLAVYYLFRMGFIVDQIVNVDAPAATYAQQASIEMLEARRAERNYLLLHDPAYLQANRDSVNKVKEVLEEIRELGPDNENSVAAAEAQLALYQKQFSTAVTSIGQPGPSASERIREVVRAYEDDLNELLRGARYKSRAKLIDELRNRVGSFDSQISETVQEGNPALRQATEELQSSSQELLKLASDLESRNWRRVEDDRNEARRLLFQAEWALSIVSACTLLFSVWVSFVLPRQVVKPLVSLREAVDHAASGNYEIDFDIQGEGEVVELAKSLRKMFASVRLHANTG
jgi:CHASE3 domain sensor protein